MSIFPKRTIQNSTVTIHWNFNTAHLKDTHLAPFVKIGVKDPEGNVTMLFENYVIAFPNPIENKKEVNAIKKPKYLNKNTPLLVIADYLEGSCKREKLVDILTNIQSGRHYYFTYKVPENAPLGKYTLVSEIHNSGNIKYSKTANDDHFWVEKISHISTKQQETEKTAVIHNPSKEPTPVKIINTDTDEKGLLKTDVDAFIMSAEETKTITLNEKGNTFLLYNEEREVLNITEETNDYLIRNQEVLFINKENGSKCLLKKNDDEAFWLSPEAYSLWKKADGLLHKDNLSETENDVLKEMEAQELIKQLKP